MVGEHERFTCLLALTFLPCFGTRRISSGLSCLCGASARRCRLADSGVVCPTPMNTSKQANIQKSDRACPQIQQAGQSPARLVCMGLAMLARTRTVSIRASPFRAPLGDQEVFLLRLPAFRRRD